MNFEAGTIIKPLPTDDYILKKEKAWRVKLPYLYKEFVKKFGGGIPEKCSFTCNRHEYAIDRFLCILSEYRTHQLGDYDIGVTITQIEDRLSDNPDLLGTELVPIAVLFAGDFICLDYRNSKENPSICVWSHEESGVDEPVTYYVAPSFEAFLKMLH